MPIEIALFFNCIGVVYNINTMKNNVQVMEYALPVTIEPLKEGGYLARCKKLQGCIAEGKTIEEAINILGDVAKNIIDLRREEGMVIPLRVIKEIDTQSSFTFTVPLVHQIGHISHA